MSLKSRTTLAVEKAFSTMKSFLEPVTITRMGASDYDPETGNVTHSETSYSASGFVLNIVRKPTEDFYSESDKFDFYFLQKDLPTYTPQINDEVTYRTNKFKVSRVDEDTAHITWALTLAEI